jgi:hypothetical protein
MSIATVRESTTLKKLAAASILGTVLALTLSLTTVSAAAVSTVKGNGSGVTESGIPCAGVPKGDIITFLATKSMGKVSGFAIFAQFLEPSGAFSKRVVFTRGHVNRTNYRLEGTVSGIACGAKVSGTAVVRGDCGTGVIIHYSDSGGEKGDLKGDVVCS